MGYRNYTKVWIGLDMPKITEMSEDSSTKFYHFIEEKGYEMDAEYIDCNWVLHHYASTKACNWDHIEEEKDNPFLDWNRLFVINKKLELKIAGKGLYEFGVVGSEYGEGWGLLVCENLANAENPKEIYDEAEKLKEIYEEVIEKYFEGEDARFLLENMKIHTATVEE